MSAPFATPADVALLMKRDLTDDETTLAERKLVVASAKIRARFPTIDSRITAGTIDPGLVTDVAAEMVKRYLQARDPGDAIREEAGPFAEAWSRGDGGAVELTGEDLALLAPASLGRPRYIALGLGIAPP